MWQSVVDISTIVNILKQPVVFHRLSISVGLMNIMMSLIVSFKNKHFRDTSEIDFVTKTKNKSK